MTGLSAAALDVAAITNAVRHRGHGAILVFEGVARDHFGGRPVLGLSYEAWESQALLALQAICAEAEAQFGVRAVIVHRTGEVGIGEPSVVIAVGAAHRAAAYDGSRYCIEALKVRVPVWKKEHYTDGAEWIANKP